MVRENSGNRQVNVWQQTKVQTWTRFWEPMGIWNGRARYWVNSSFLCSRSPTRDLGNQTSAWVHWTWHCNHFWQVLAILQPKWCRLHPPDGQAKRKPKAINGTIKAKLPGYLDEFNWSKLHPETNQGDRFNHMLSHISEMVPLN